MNKIENSGFYLIILILALGYSAFNMRNTRNKFEWGMMLYIYLIWIIGLIIRE